ncbi:MAG TPA: hypothetical protein VJI33_02385 [Candidatus Paceibacterota bacterium]
MKNILLSVLLGTTTLLAADSPPVPSVPNEKDAPLVEVQLGKESYTISIKWSQEEKEMGGKVFDVVVGLEAGKRVEAIRMIAFGADSAEWEWDSRTNSFGAALEPWLKYATNLMDRFIVSGQIAADKVPWKYVGKAARLHHYEAPYDFVFERGGRYLVITWREWLGEDPKKVGDSINIAEYHAEDQGYPPEAHFFAATLSSEGKISMGVDVMNDITELEKRLAAQKKAEAALQK